jgi:hypothetical protein
MFRKTMLSLLVFLAAGLVEVRSTDAAPISPRNPYRSFNIGGVNYGSMQWERAHRGGRGYGHSHRGLFFRRR